MFAMPWRWKSMGLNSEGPPMPPAVHQGTTFHIADFRVHEESTKPPDYLQESELIALMDKHGIGTDASIPQHIKNLCDR